MHSGRGTFVDVPALLRTRAGTSHIDATSRKDFLRRYCKEPSTTFVLNDIDTKNRFQNQKVTAAMGGLLPLNFTCFRITLQANALRVIFRMVDCHRKSRFGRPGEQDCCSDGLGSYNHRLYWPCGQLANPTARLVRRRQADRKIPKVR